ncbi:MAG TPA: SH3-like domain-containing protein [Chloroflexota bacterium]|nr:SH3-like domain-containing protein [Chloroflexota bacterium]
MPDHRFRVGDRVRVLEANPSGNPRTPVHLRGKTGTIVELCGTMENPLDHRDVYPPLCKVEFAIREVFGTDSPDKLFADIHEEWLSYADGEPREA